MATDARIVRVAVDALADHPERTFSYRLPPEAGPSEPGSLVLVPYGRRTALGYLLPSLAGTDGTADGTLDGPLRDVEAVVSGPMLTPDLLAIAQEIAAYYRAPVGTTIAAMLPPGLESRLDRRWVVTDANALPPALRGDLVPDPDGGESLSDAALRRHAPTHGATAWVERLRRSGVIAARWALRPPDVREQFVRTLRRTGAGEPPKRAPVQRAVLDLLTDEPRPIPELAEELGMEPAALLAPARRLAAAGLAELDRRAAPRAPLDHRRPTIGGHALTGEQAAALEAATDLPPGGELVLEGVAASGKSDVYLALVEETFAAERSAIVLVPEVSLVPQLVDRVTALAGESVGVLHSGLSAGERHDEWWRILRGEARVVVGTRTAVFAPLGDLGLIVIDEAHDGGYKSDRTPRYDARWVARRRADRTGARLVSGTATPDVATIAAVRDGSASRAGLVERRVGRAPTVDVVDMRAELASGNRSILSNALADAIAALEIGAEQAILLINRRGAATFVLCRDCGESLRCPDCDLPFVFHLAGSTLRCHHCGRTASSPQRCPRCDSRRIRYFGAGTQRVEAELRSRFPALRIGRLDSDALAVRRGFEAVYDDLRAGRLDVLVGTQLAAKGLDLPAVTLAAVVAADVTLNLPDYRSAERTFQLLAQVAGRAGRGDRPGRVIFQTYAPDHYAVRTAATLDVDAFADEELMRRRLLGYPPYGVLARLIVADADRGRAEDRGRAAAAAVATDGVEVLGPLPAYVARRANRWRFQIVLRAPDIGTRLTALERVPAGVAIDVDPESLL